MPDLSKKTKVGKQPWTKLFRIEMHRSWDISGRFHLHNRKPVRVKYVRK